MRNSDQVPTQTQRSQGLSLVSNFPNDHRGLPHKEEEVGPTVSLKLMLRSPWNDYKISFVEIDFVRRCQLDVGVAMDP